MKKLAYENLIHSISDKELFFQWLRNFFYLNSELNKEYDTIYQNLFYINYYELMTVGLDYAHTVSKSLIILKDAKVKIFYAELVRELEGLKNLFPEDEFEFIEYKRHSCSHIFQNSYRKQLKKNGEVNTIRKKKSIDELNSRFKDILLKYGFDKGFDEYMSDKLFIPVTQFHEKLDRLQQAK